MYSRSRLHSKFKDCRPPLVLCWLACVGACSFDTSAPVGAGAGAGGDAALLDAQVYLDDGGRVSDSAPSIDGQPPNTACQEAPFVERPGFPHRYYAEDTPLNYDEAQASCMAAGGHLVVLNDPAEEVFVSTLGGGERWFGFNDLDTEDNDNGGVSFAWVNGESPGHTNWKTGEPNDGPMDDEDCATLKGGEWEDKKCGETRGSVCECDPASVVAAPPACMDNSAYNLIGGRRYRLERTAETYVNAQASCAADGAHLVVIADSKEDSYIYSTDPGSPPWIGINDIESEGTFSWVTGSTNPYRRWANGVPNNGGLNQDCVEMRADRDWHNNVCTLSNKFVCECDPLYLPAI